MSGKRKKNQAVVFSPNLRADDAAANYWMRQATLRLRREIAWLWHERGAGAAAGPAVLPPPADRLSATLDLTRFWAEKREFFAADPAAEYLSGQLAEPPPPLEDAPRGSFGWVVRELALDDAAAFVLALVLAGAFDASLGSVVAACLNDVQKTAPNLMLGQLLWDAPEDLLALADPQHALFAYGILSPAGGAARFYADDFWERPLAVAPLVARRLLAARSPSAGRALTPLAVPAADEAALTPAGRLVGYRLRAARPERLRIVPLLARKGAARRETVAALARLGEREVFEFGGDARLLENAEYLRSLAVFCWLEGRDLFIEPELSDEVGPPPALPLDVFRSFSEGRAIERIDETRRLATVVIPPLVYAERLACWRRELGSAAAPQEAALAEVARRFRFEKETIAEVCRELRALPGEPSAEDFIAACRAVLTLDVGELAAPVAPRFADEKLILPPPQSRQFDEQLTAMRMLTRVHYEWGTARVWNESGITILFAGPPGTGKTMAAEIMAAALDLPMYRVDLSQVVNKYVGETEKNLKRIFDAADVSDALLFFDEADALFGKRTEVSDSRDRYANLEISYLLERMERFKGLAILATNRKKDLDGAFLRRLRYILDFPLPGEAERRRIWEQIVPAGTGGELDLDFLARQFPLAGGNIRSIVFNACLQSAAAAKDAKILLMKDVLVAVRREYDKLNRVISAEQFGPYAGAAPELE